jgi:hypothetical protein
MSFSSGSARPPRQAYPKRQFDRIVSVETFEHMLNWPMAMLGQVDSLHVRLTSLPIAA